MLVEIGTIVAVYAIVRLIQVPIESASSAKEGFQNGHTQALAGFSTVGIVLILMMLIALWSRQGQPIIPPAPVG